MPRILLFILLMINYSYADPDWRKYGWQIFDNAGDARSIAMGNTTIADYHINSTLWNPGIVSISDMGNFTYGHQSRFAGIIQSDFFAYPFALKSNKKINLLILHEAVGDIPNTENLLLDWGLDGVPNTGDQGENNGYLDEGERLDRDDITYFSQHQVGVQLNTNIEIFKLDVGIGIKGLLHTLGNNWGTGIGLDVGIQRKLFKNTKFGFAIRNFIPGMMIWDSELIELTKPQLFTGLSQAIEIPNWKVKILMLGDIILNISDESLGDDFNIGATGGNYRFGSEISYKDRLNVRVGRNQYGYFSTGIGLNWTNFGLNYGYQMNSNSTELGSNHVLSFEINPNWLKSLVSKSIKNE